MELIGAGRDAEVFALDAVTVLRRYRDGRSPAAEADLMTELAAFGYPVPSVFALDGADLVMQRVVGDTLAQLLVEGGCTAAEAASITADLLTRLHELTADGDSSRLHLDLHPLNILIGPDGPVVIDWTNSRRGEPGFDIAMSAVIMAQAALTPGLLSSVGLPEQSAGVLGRFVAEFMALVPPPTDAQIEQARQFRAGDPNLSQAEQAYLDQSAELVRQLRTGPVS